MFHQDLNKLSSIVACWWLEILTLHGIQWHSGTVMDLDVSVDARYL